MKRILIAMFMGLVMQGIHAQEIRTVEAKGLGIGRNDALQDALRNAVSQAVGVALSSQTSVENFMVISDAIATNTQGYIKSYTVTSEKPSGDNYEVNVKAEVTTSPIKADFNLLAKGVGGVRFMAMYDTRSITSSQKSDYDFVLDQINKYFASKKYRYIDRNRFLSLQKEALMMMEDQDTSGISYAQQLALLADAQFLVLVRNIRKEVVSEQFDTKVKSRIVVDAVTLDNCTGEGLGSVSLQGSWQDGNANTNQPGIASALQRDMDTLLSTFSAYIGSWINNGTPFEVRFYSTGTYRDLRDLRTKMKADPAFGGDMEVVSAGDFTKINCTYKKKPDELADKILDYSDQIPSLHAKKLDVKLIYGRQISFAPQGTEIKKTKVSNALKEHEEQNKTAPQPDKKEEEQLKTTPSPVSNGTNKGPMGGVVVFTEAGEKFWLIVNGTKINNEQSAKVSVGNIEDGGAKVRVIFADSKIKPIDDRLTVLDQWTGEVFRNTYAIKKKKNKYSIRLVASTSMGRRIKDENGNGKDDYEEERERRMEEMRKEKEQQTTDNTSSPSPAPSNNSTSTAAVSCTMAMPEDEFAEALSQMSSAKFGGQFNVASNMFGHNCVNLSQVKRMIGICSFDDDKLKMAQLSYKYCIDKPKYYLLGSLFTFSSTKEKFNSFLSNQAK